LRARAADAPGWHNALFRTRGNTVSQEERFVDIEIKLAHQEDLVETLNRTVYEQGRHIDQLEALVKQLADHVRTLRESGQQPVNERPPHY
jgi:SlyX protein